MTKRKLNVEVECLNCGKIFHPFESAKNPKFCCKKCGFEYKHRTKYEEYLKDPSPYENQYWMSWIKPHILKEQNHQCAICGIKDEWNNKPLVFVLDHIDGHAYNNERSNLRLICSNCDSQLDTYKSRNKRSDRHEYIKNLKSHNLEDLKPKETPKCPICGKEVSEKGCLCLDCFHKSLRRTTWPTRDELKNLIRILPSTEICKQFRVSNTTLYNWCRSMSLPHNFYKIKKISNEEWKLI